MWDYLAWALNALMESELGRGCRLLQTSTSLLEASEIEAVFFSHLLQLYTISNTAAGTHYIGQRRMLQHLFTILRLGSPRTQCLCLRILRQVVPQLEPGKVLPAIPAWVSVNTLRSATDPSTINSLTAALLNFVGTCLLPITGTTNASLDIASSTDLQLHILYLQHYLEALPTHVDMFTNVLPWENPLHL